MSVAVVAGLAAITEGPVGTAAAVGEAAKRTPEKAVDALIQVKTGYYWGAVELTFARACIILLSLSAFSFILLAF